jgi:hypothetical protein
MMPFSAPLRLCARKKINMLHRIVQMSIADTILKNRSPTLPPCLALQFPVLLQIVNTSSILHNAAHQKGHLSQTGKSGLFYF